MNALPITTLYAGLLGLILIWLSARVVQARLAHEVSIGDGGQADILVAIRGQGNFIEYVPIALLLIGLGELGGSPSWLLHGLGLTLVLARIAHPFGLASTFELRVPRVAGAMLTLIVIGIASLNALLLHFRS